MLACTLTVASTVAVGPAKADIVNVQLTSTQIESSTAVVNSSLANVHPPLQVQDWDDDFALPAITSSFAIGDGRHGSFGLATFLNFHDGTYNNDGIIRINTDTYPDLQFTDFTLPTGYQLVPTGSRPLVIRSLSTVTIAGQIVCSGGVGGDIGSALIPSGGAARCGGSMGGRAGTALLNATAGSQSTSNPSVAGGGAGTSQGDGDGGGGGAGMDQSAPGPSVGINGGITAGGGGIAGLGGTDSSFATEGGGAGGGGGSAFTDGSDPAGASTGAGGGAGGGSVYLYSVGDMIVAGTISADGGAGGGGLAPAKGGGGGGGGGGSILMYSAGTITINGITTAVGGIGGTSPGGDGGVGGSGRTWVIDDDSVPTLGAMNSLEPLGILPTWGQVNYQVGTFTVVTKTVDLDNSQPLFLGASVSSTSTGASNASVEVASADQPFDVSAAVWVSASSVTGSRIKRYVRLRLTLDNQVAASPIRATNVLITYTPADQTAFKFATCQASTVGPLPPSGPSNGMMILAMMLPLALALALRDRRQTSDRPSYQPTPK
ncbi:MAG: hypothetical protein AAB250_01605 [Bdellovibrionota bacterium]